MKKQTRSYGYCHVVISAPGQQRLMYTNNERAFVISLLQDLLSTRLLIGTVPAYAQLASCIDLLAFSISPAAIQLVLFSIDSSIVAQLTNSIMLQLREYQSEYQPTSSGSAYGPSVRIKKLRGPHHALASSVTLHMSHKDWEYDRYSSIGFYLHDRRGDWMRIWRLAQLYDNKPGNYRQLLKHTNRTYSASLQPIIQQFAS